jgi:hypothetical protein
LKTDQWIKVNNGSLAMSQSIQIMGVESLGSPNIWLDVMNDPYRYLTPPNMPAKYIPPGGPQEPYKKLVITFRTRFNLTLCEVGTEYVDARIDCSRAVQDGELACFVSKMRRSPESIGLGNLTALDIGRTTTAIKHIPYTLASLHNGEASILEKWLSNPPTALQSRFALPNGWCADITRYVFSRRLAMVLNTYLRATLNMTITVGSDGSSIDHRDATWANTTGTWTQFTEPVYQVSGPWFALYCVSAVVLALATLMNLVLRSLIHVPDFLGSISALTRDSLFVDVPTPASSMDGTERARLLQDKWVMIQDVRPDEAVGRIAFSDAMGNVGLRMERRYA